MAASSLRRLVDAHRTERVPLELQLQGYRLATAEILYHMPDHPGLLQTFVWQHYDIGPETSRAAQVPRFLVKNIDGKLHSVTVARSGLIGPARHQHAGGIWQLH